jgi:hypothetical protein
VTGAGAIAGIGFTVSLLIASLAFHGSLLAEAKVGVLSAALCASAAARQGTFWPMHDQLLAHQDALTADDLLRYAAELGLDTGRFTADLRRHAGEAKITVRAAKAHALIGSGRQPQRTS